MRARQRLAARRTGKGGSNRNCATTFVATLFVTTTIVAIVAHSTRQDEDAGQVRIGSEQRLIIQTPEEIVDPDTRQPRPFDETFKDTDDFTPLNQPDLASVAQVRKTALPLPTNKSAAVLPSKPVGTPSKPVGTRLAPQERRVDSVANDVRAKPANPMLLDLVADAALKNGFKTARTLVEEALSATLEASESNDLATASQLLDAAIAAEQQIIESFRADIGKTIAVKTRRGTLSVNIVKVEGSTVQYKYLAGTSGGLIWMTLGVEDLSAEERNKRLGLGDGPGETLVRGLLATRSGAVEQAQELFAATSSSFGDCLARRLKLVAPPMKASRLSLSAQASRRGALL